MAYLATQNVPGYLPMDDDPPTFDTARGAWHYLREELERGELAYEPERADDPDGPQKLTATALELERQAEGDRVGTVYGPSGLGDDAPIYDLGLAYSVTVVEPERCACGTCGGPLCYRSGGGGDY